MGKYIDADRVMQFWKTWAERHEMFDAMAFYEDLDLTPAADVIPLDEVNKACEALLEEYRKKGVGIFHGGDIVIQEIEWIQKRLNTILRERKDG